MKRRQEFAKRLKILGKKDGEAIVQRGVEKAERIIEETEDDEIKTALNVLNEYIINHIKKLPAQEQKKAIDELIDKILNSDNIEHNEEIAIGVITLTKLNEEDEIPISERRELIKAIDDDEKRKEQLEKLKKEEEKRKKKIIQKERKILQKVYSECGKETPDNELVMKVETAISKTPHLSSVKLKLLSEIMSAKEMKQIGIIDLVEEESIKLSNGKEKEFNEKRDLERRLNKEIQEEYAKYNEKDEMEKVINMLKAFPKEDRIKIIEEIKDFVSNKTKQLNAKKVDEEER